MTYIEFFDNTHIENICSILSATPKRVVFIGEDAKAMSQAIDDYKEIFDNRGIEIEFLYKTVNKNSFEAIKDCLIEIIEKYGEVSVDLTGGEDLMLVAIGVIIERYKDKSIKFHRFNLHNNTIYDCDADDVVPKTDNLSLTVDEYIKAFGGRVVYTNENTAGTYEWNMTDDFIKDINSIWQVCKFNTILWNVQIGVLEAVKNLYNNFESLNETVNLNSLKIVLKNNKQNFYVNKGILYSLKKFKLIDYKITDSEFSITYKNEQVKRCLTKAGLALEMKVFAFAHEMKNQDNTPYFNVKNGVYIDWDGETHSKEEKIVDTSNEIDVIAMKGIVPVFISCKNGAVTMEELYKLNTVANKFGGGYSKKVIIATSLDNKKAFTKQFKERAKDMNIRIIDNFLSLSDSEMKHLFEKIWREPNIVGGKYGK